jgi:hypothetical protein
MNLPGGSRFVSELWRGTVAAKGFFLGKLAGRRKHGVTLFAATGFGKTQGRWKPALAGTGD